jgi:hypothetical protein
MTPTRVKLALLALPALAAVRAISFYRLHPNG